MPKPPLPPELDAFLAEPNPSVIATVEPDGHPHTAASWYLWEDGRVLVNMDAGRKRLGHLRADPRVSITVTHMDDWSRHVTLRGRVVDFDEDALADIDRIAEHYTGRTYRNRENRRVSAWIEVDRWYAWGGSGPWRPSP